MATGFMIASAAVGVVGAVKGKKAAKKGAKEQYALDQENIENQKKETEESIRRTEESQEKIEANISTNIAASGFAVGSSLDSYLSSVKAENASDIDWMRTSGASRDAISEREASARSRATKNQASAQFVSGIGSAMGTAAGATSSYEKYGWGFTSNKGGGT